MLSGAFGASKSICECYPMSAKVGEDGKCVRATAARIEFVEQKKNGKTVKSESGVRPLAGMRGEGERVGKARG